ncbi:type II toxin-antitoxin system HipA family toxin [Butyrivibrio sp. AE2032]|uniref:type II toxin-antitoxin system HipA family toxin n=1 Tax=Butyrivibrio sp. AE2032 TaxID=1458463 RepID=UPI0005594C3E|nr:type II toxin-antitoxin system HipA family toxin [Butyrivibrio sp. AE2032]
MSKKKEIFIYAGWLNDDYIGTIHSEVVSGNEVVSFEYSREWLQEHSSLILDPTIPQVTYRSYSMDKQLFGAFEDSCPDRWGRKLIDRREALYAIKEKRAPRKFFETDYLLGVQDNYRLGGFRFKIEPDGEFLENDILPVPPITAIRELEQISLGYEKDSDNRWVEQLVATGSSLGGARPKANVADTDGSLWIAKFPSQNDTYDVGAWEKTANDLALKCGLNVPEYRLMKLSENGSTFLSKRFDRSYLDGNTKRIHYASAMTMLGARDGNTDGLGYLDLAEVVERLTHNTEKNLHDLYKHMLFDIAISNQDDHLRNHGFLLYGDSWELSPVFDINPVANAQFLNMNIDIDSGFRSFDKALETCEFYHYSKDEAGRLIREFSEIISNTWKETASKNGIKESEQKYMSSAFSLAEETYKMYG